MKFPIKYFFSECDQIRSFLRIWSYLSNKSLMENFSFGALRCFRNIVKLSKILWQDNFSKEDLFLSYNVYEHTSHPKKYLPVPCQQLDTRKIMLHNFTTHFSTLSIVNF